MSPTCRFIAQMATGGLGQPGHRNQELLVGLPHVYRGPTTGASSFQARWLPRDKPAPPWDAAVQVMALSARPPFRCDASRSPEHRQDLMPLTRLGVPLPEPVRGEECWMPKTFPHNQKIPGIDPATRCPQLAHFREGGGRTNRTLRACCGCVPLKHGQRGHRSDSGISSEA